jgi:hypothetical protein
LSWEAETKTQKAAPRAISEGRVLFAHKLGKADSTAAAAVLATMMTVVVGGKQTKKKSKKRQRQVSELRE